MIIVGGGIIGASFAYHASIAGLKDVTLLTSALPGDKTQATSSTWGWVNGYAPNDKNYAAFRLANLKYWPKIINGITNIKMTSQGALFWDSEEKELTEIINQHQNWGHNIINITQAEIGNYIPGLLNKPQNAGFGKNDLALEGPKIAKELIKASGFKVKRVNVSKLVCEKNKVIGVETNEGIFYTDEVIIAAGLGSPKLISSLKINFKMRSSLGLLAYTNQLPNLILKYPITGNDFHARQDDEGRLVIGGKFDDDANKEKNIQEAAENLVHDMKLRLNYNGELKLDYYTLGNRPLPIDGRPKIGRLKNNQGEKIKGIYIAVMHSGITNAPLAGKLGIEEIVTEKRHPLLSDFFPQKLIEDKINIDV